MWKKRCMVEKQVMAKKQCMERKQCGGSEVVLMLKLLKKIGAPVVLMSLVVAIMTLPGLDHSRNVHWVEYFAGQKAVTSAMLSAWLLALSFEIKDQQRIQNMLHEMGFVYAIHLGLKIVPGGGSNTAPVCSTWVWLSRGSTYRTAFNAMGDLGLDCVRKANVMVSRVMLLCWLHCAMKAFWVLEQPVNSLMEMHERFQELASKIKIYRTTIHMGRFGGALLKPLWL